jgi:hypothetical protein
MIKHKDKHFGIRDAVTAKLAEEINTTPVMEFIAEMEKYRSFPMLRVIYPVEVLGDTAISQPIEIEPYTSFAERNNGAETKEMTESFQNGCTYTGEARDDH